MGFSPGISWREKCWMQNFPMIHPGILGISPGDPTWCPWNRKKSRSLRSSSSSSIRRVWKSGNSINVPWGGGKKGIFQEQRGIPLEMRGKEGMVGRGWCGISSRNIHGWENLGMSWRSPGGVGIIGMGWSWESGNH